jgi:hypothetical protein
MEKVSVRWRTSPSGFFVWPGCSGVGILARHRRIKDVTSTRLMDLRPLPHPCGRSAFMTGVVGFRVRTLRGPAVFVTGPRRVC